MKTSDEIRKIMESLPDHLVKVPIKIHQKKKSRLEELDEMKKACSEKWNVEYGRYLSGDKDLINIKATMYRMLKIDEDWLTEKYRVEEEMLIKQTKKTLHET